MKQVLLDLLVCPTCLPQENRLVCKMKERQGENILSGSLQCDQCGTSYPIRGGLASLLPRSPETRERVRSRYESSSILSSYLWSHYGDMLKDEEARTAYTEWATLIEYQSGFSLDAGCAVGRFTFEMSKKSDFVVGVDNSLPFILTAREIMKSRRLGVSIPEEGFLRKQETISLPETWGTEKVDFILGDAQFLPFRSRVFTSLASLNLVDKLPLPLMHLKEMNRVAKQSGAQFLFSDPFSWSSEIAQEKDWLGGTSNGPFPGKGINNILSLLKGEKEELSPAWNIDKQGHVWWTIRTHRNHFELIRSCYIKTSR